MLSLTVNLYCLPLLCQGLYQGRDNVCPVLQPGRLSQIMKLQAEANEKPREPPQNEGLWGHGRAKPVPAKSRKSSFCCFASSAAKEDDHDTGAKLQDKVIIAV